MLTEDVPPVFETLADLHENHIWGLGIYDPHGKYSLGLGVSEYVMRAPAFGFHPIATR